ncbi:MAG TPA: hypothetical protein VL197_12715 [Nitrospirota bacterium]|nr:hypothetical protein [Nitrospirota bacterium]
MSVQSIGSTGSTQYLSTLTDDFKNLQNDIKAVEDAKNSGSQDQVTLSQDALQKAMNQFKNDLAGLTQGAQGHHHHHHHKVANSNSDPKSNTGTTVSSVANAASQYSAQPQINVGNIDLIA